MQLIATVLLNESPGNTTPLGNAGGRPPQQVLVTGDLGTHPSTRPTATHPVLVQEGLVNVAGHIQQRVSHAQQGALEARHFAMCWALPVVLLQQDRGEGPVDAKGVLERHQRTRISKTAFGQAGSHRPPVTATATRLAKLYAALGASRNSDALMRLSWWIPHFLSSSILLGASSPSTQQRLSAAVCVPASMSESPAFLVSFQHVSTLGTC